MLRPVGVVTPNNCECRCAIYAELHKFKRLYGNAWATMAPLEQIPYPERTYYDYEKEIQGSN